MHKSCDLEITTSWCLLGSIADDYKMEIGFSTRICEKMIKYKQIILLCISGKLSVDVLNV